MITKFWTLAGCLFLPLALCSQASFIDRSDLLGINGINSAVPVAVADMNGDKLDDLIVMDEGKKIVVQYQTPSGERPFVRYEPLITLAVNEQNDISIADFNNDGVNDIFTIGSYDEVKVLYGRKFSYGFDKVNISVLPFFSQGASTGDFNGDGWVDIVILNDNGLNYTMMNDGAGNLQVQNFFNFVTVPPSDNSGNYGSVYTDFDMDGDSDFYIAKCRQGVNNPSDPRRINVLFENDGNNNYTERAAVYGLASGRQTWTADFGDIDNDGDQDVFMTQHDVISELYENINNDTFINITEDAGLVIPGIPLQGMFRDFDNDGFIDILVSGDRVDYYHNNGDKTFSEVSLFGNTVFGTFALGDLNDDGFTDIYASRVIPFNQPDLLREDILYLNEPNDNHFLALTLSDVVNTSAIGATASLYGEWGIQIREVRGGEQYGVSNSHQMIFGLGDHTAYDSLVIRWPDGSRSTHTSLTIDNKWIITKDGCATTPRKAWDDVYAICSPVSVGLQAPDEIGSVEWSTGLNDDLLLVTEEGIYFATYSDSNGCSVLLESVEITKDPDTIRPEIVYEGNTLLCNKEVAIISVSPGLSYTWSSGDTTRVIEATSSGEYFVAVQGFCKALYSDTITLEFVVPEAPDVHADTFTLGSAAIFSAVGDSILWYADSAGTIVLGSGPVLTIDGATETTTVYAENIQAIEGLEYNVGPTQQVGFPKYGSNFINGGLLFEVYETIILESFTVFTDTAGTRVIEFSDGDNFFYQHEVTLEPGMTVIDLNLEIPAGVYTVTTNADANVDEFGVVTPHLWRSSDAVLFPYEVPNVLSIYNSNYGLQYYYYFYDWQIMTKDKYCESDLAPVTAVLDFEVSSNDPQAGQQIHISPNPTDGKVIIDYEGLQEYKVFTLTGEEVRQGIVNIQFIRHEVDLTSLEAGIYFIALKSLNGNQTRRLVKL